MQSLSAAETLAEAIGRRPALASLLKAFSPYLELRAELPSRLMAAVELGGGVLPAWDAAQASLGVPLLGQSELSFEILGEALRLCAGEMLPVLEKAGLAAGHGAALDALFLEGDGAVRAAKAFFDADAEELSALAAEASLPEDVLAFAAEAVLGPVLRAAVMVSVPAATEGGAAPWDERLASWGQGFCPVCGSAPSVAWLEEKVFDEKNAFVSGGGGKKHLHCGLCGTDWHFRRGVCPSCGRDDADAIEILRETEDARGERLEWCTHCKAYGPSVDLRERSTRPDMDALALSMLHLDMVAAERGLAPLYPTFWNLFRS